MICEASGFHSDGRIVIWRAISVGVFSSAQKRSQMAFWQTLIAVHAPFLLGILFDMSSALVWFRRDLRIEDHAALFHALTAHEAVYCVFVFDINILSQLPSADRRIEFILRSVEALADELQALGGHLIVLHGDPVLGIPALAAQLKVQAVYANRDYEPAAMLRDAAVKEALLSTIAGVPIDFLTFKDQVIFECDEVLTQQGTPFAVFTPYKNAWLQKLAPVHLQSYPVARHAGSLVPENAHGLRADHAMGEGTLTDVVRYAKLPTLTDLGFEPTNLASLPMPVGMQGARRLFLEFTERIDHYASDRDFPSANGTSSLSPHLRFGTISIRQLANYAQGEAGRGAATWLSELIWRDFYHMILWHHPQVVTQAFKPAMNSLAWDDRPDFLVAWQEGRTGYPLVDAAMRQLLQTGLMHNRLRMLSASFLTKDLGVDWRFGEAWFAQHLLDYDLAANNGGWQWAASTGCDAQPWFRIFNPVTQSEKFDPQGVFIRRYLPELASVPEKYIHAPWKIPSRQASLLMGHAEDGAASGYPLPIVDHLNARERTLQRFSLVNKAQANKGLKEKLS